MIDESDKMAPDVIATLLGQVRSGSVAARERAARDMLVAVHGAVYPMCLKLLGNADDALEAEAESVARLLTRSDDREAAPITNGAAYVRQIARNVCADLHRESRRRHDRSVDELDPGQLPTVGDPAAAMNTPVATPTLVDRDLIATFGYTSKRALADLACLTRQELTVVILRQEGYPYPRIAGIVGAGLTTAAAEKQGERGLHKLRGLVHVGVWRQQHPATWADPRCPELAEFQAQVRQQLLAGATITATMYLRIGRHLDPDPNRRPGDRQDRVCALCAGERDRSRREYWWLLIMLWPIPVPARQPTPRPVSLNTGRRWRNRPGGWIAAAIVLLLLLGGAVLAAPRVRAQQNPATPHAARPGAGSGGSGGTPDPTGTTTASTGPSAHPNAGPTGDPSGDPTDGSSGDPGPEPIGEPSTGPPDDPGAQALPSTGPGPCDQVPAGGGAYRPFVGSTGGLCWLASAGWHPLPMGGLTAEPQDIRAVDVDGGRAVFFTATDSYVRGGVVDNAGTLVSGWHLFRARADGWSSGFNISTRQPVRAIATTSSLVDLFAVGLDEVVWHRRVEIGNLDSGTGWHTLLDYHAFSDGGRFWPDQSLGALGNGNATGLAKDNITYQACYPSDPDPSRFRWIRVGSDCPPPGPPPGPR